MGKKRKLSQRNQRRGTWPTRGKQSREVINLIVEGATERAYLRALLDHRYPGIFAPQWHRSGSSSRTSLKDLLSKAQRVERERGGQRAIWVVCDVDKNDVHRKLLERWREASPTHRSALQAVSIECWILQHLDNPARPLKNGEALHLVMTQWDAYKKGGEIPRWLIERTDEACRRESCFLGDERNDGVWPLDLSSQLPLLIAYLDERARARGQEPKGLNNGVD